MMNKKFLAHSGRIFGTPHFTNLGLSSQITQNYEGKTLPAPHIDLRVEHTFTPPVGKPYTLTSLDVVAFNQATWNPETTLTTYQVQVVGNTIQTIFNQSLTLDECAEIEKMGALAETIATGIQKRTLKDAIETLNPKHILNATHTMIQVWKAEPAGETKTAMAQKLHDLYVAIGWLEKGWMFQNYDDHGKADSIIPKAIAMPYMILSQLVGGMPEFDYYHHYVGAACRNQDEMWAKMDTVDFENPASIVEWVNAFKPIYSFIPEGEKGHQSEVYFRFIHLAMEMIFSKHVQTIIDHYESGDPDRISTGLKLELEVTEKMNQIFITLPEGSNPKEYPHYVRKYIAGTFGDNCGTVFEPRGKFLEGCGTEGYVSPDGHFKTGKWGKYVGQTGANTSAVPANDELTGGATEFYKKPPHMPLIRAILTDNQLEAPHHYEDFRARKGYSPLDLMLTYFRTVTRPPSHAHLILTSKTAFEKVQKSIQENITLMLDLAEAQLYQGKHRTDHYRYVKTYINDQDKSGQQQKTTGTGGSKTTGFLPRLIEGSFKQFKATMAAIETSAGNELKELDDFLTAEQRLRFDELNQRLEALKKEYLAIFQQTKAIQQTEATSQSTFDTDPTNK